MRVDPRAERAAPWLAGLLFAVPIVVMAYPPMQDLPYHEATVSLLRHFGDPTFAPPGLFQRNFGHGNQLFHVLALALSYVVSTALACKLVVGAIVVANVVLAGRLAAHLGASRWTALLIVPAVVGWLFLMGFAHDLLGLALLPAALQSLDAYTERPTGRGLLVMAAWVVALHFAHESGMVVFCGLVLVFAAGHRLELRGTALRVAPFVMGLAVALGDIAWMRSLRGSTLDVVQTVTIPVGHKLTTIPIILCGRYAWWLVYPLFGLVMVGLVLLVVERWREKPAPAAEPADATAKPPGRATAFVHLYRFELSAAAAFAGFLVFPSTLNGALLVYQRFLAPAFVLAVIAAAPRREASMRAGARVVACLVPIVTMAAFWPALEDSSAVRAQADALIPRVAPGSAVTLIILDPPEWDRPYTVYNAGLRVFAERGGRFLPAFTESPNSPVVTNPALRWDEESLRLLRQGFAPAHDFHRFRYAIVHTRYDGNAAVAVEAMKPEGRFLGQSGEFLLFESTLDVVPVASPDVPLEDPPPASLLDRMGAVARKWRARMAAPR